MRTFNTADAMYRTMIEDILGDQYGHSVGNTREVRDRVYRLTDISDPIIKMRDISQSYCAAELTWYLAGDNSVDFIGRYGSMWKRISDDGITNNSAYGYIIKSKHKFNQLEKVIELLTTDPDSRRAVININIPNRDVIETHDEMCTIALQFLLRDNKLNLSVIMRSNDMYFGLPYDIIYFIELQKYVADRLGVEYGDYTHHAISLHIYNKDLNKFKDMLDGKCVSNFKIDHKKLWQYSDEIYTQFLNYHKQCDSGTVEFNKEFPSDIYWKYNIFYN